MRHVPDVRGFSDGRGLVFSTTSRGCAVKFSVPRPPLPSREAAAASVGWNVCKTLAQMVVFWGVLLFVMPLWIGRIERTQEWTLPGLHQPWIVWTGVVVFCLSSVLGISSAWVMAQYGAGTPLPFDCPRRLVLRGAYCFVRNPMALAGLGQAIGVGLYLGSWGVLAYTACGFFVWNYLVRIWEEDDLHARFGDSYDKYRANVRCWWPRTRPYKDHDC